MDIHDEKHPFIEHIQRWGNASSVALLDPKTTIFTHEVSQGIIGYRATKSCAIVFGDPVCPTDETAHLTQAFHEFCKEHKKNPMYFGVSQSFITSHVPTLFASTICIGNEVILNPLHNPMTQKGKKASLLRNKYNQGIRCGIEIHEYRSYNEQLEKQIDELSTLWLANRKGPQVALFCQFDIFKNRANKRWFFAQHNNQILGVLILNRLDAFNGWYLNMLMISPHAPSYTSEYLALGTLEILRNEACEFLSVGTLPAKELSEISGFGRFSVWCLQNAYAAVQKIFKLKERNRYWEKFFPTYQPSFFAFTQPSMKISDAFSIIRVMNGI